MVHQNETVQQLLHNKCKLLNWSHALMQYMHVYNICNTVCTMYATWQVHCGTVYPMFYLH